MVRYQGCAKLLCCDLSSEPASSTLLAVVGEKGRYTYCSDGMDQLVSAIEAGDLDGVKRVVRDENLIHRINTVTDYCRMTPLHRACS